MATKNEANDSLLRTYDRAVELFQDAPAQYERVAEIIRREAAQKNLDSVTPQKLATWWDQGLQRPQRGKGIVQVRAPISTLHTEYVVRQEGAANAIGKAMLAKLRKGAAENGIAAAQTVYLQQNYLSQMYRAIFAGKGEDRPALHQVALALVGDLAADIQAKRDGMSADDKYKWLRRISELLAQLLAMQGAIADIEVKLTGVPRAQLVAAAPVEADNDANKHLDSLAGMDSTQLAQVVESLHKQYEDLREALQPITDVGNGLVPMPLA